MKNNPTSINLDELPAETLQSIIDLSVNKSLNDTTNMAIKNPIQINIPDFEKLARQHVSNTAVTY